MTLCILELNLQHPYMLYFYVRLSISIFYYPIIFTVILYCLQIEEEIELKICIKNKIFRMMNKLN